MAGADLEILIRAAEPRDADGLATLCNLPGYRFGTMRLPFDTPGSLAKRVFRDDPNFTLLVAERDGRIVGNASLQRYAGRRSHVGAIGMGVHDEFTRRGIGRRLMTTLIDLADDWLGLVRLELEANADNAAAIALYRGFGFEIEGHARQAVLRKGRFVDNVSMARLKASPQ